MGANLGSDAKKARAAWRSKERASYIVSSGIVSPEGEEPVLRFLCEALALAPLPAPWAMHRSRKGEYFFVNRRTGMASWKHPLEPCLRELADVCRKCLACAPGFRTPLLAGLTERWEVEARGEYLKWYSVHDASGQVYYCHQETGEAMWEHPAEAVLPAHYMKIMSVRLLRDDRYLVRLGSRPSAAVAAAGAGRAQLAGDGAEDEPWSSAPGSEAEDTGGSDVDSEGERWPHLSIEIPEEEVCPAADTKKSPSGWSSQSTETSLAGESKVLGEEFEALGDFEALGEFEHGFLPERCHFFRIHTPRSTSFAEADDFLTDFH